MFQFPLLLSQPSPSTDADTFSTIGGIISAIGDVVFPEFGWLLDVGCESVSLRRLVVVSHAASLHCGF